MNGINNNVSNSNYGSFGNNGSNNPKDEKSIFDNIVDSVKEFFDGDDDKQFSSYDTRSNGYNNTANIDRAYFNSLSQRQNSYTLAPETKSESLGDKWARENESVALKQKENEIMQLKQKVGVLENRNKVLSKQNDFMSEHVVIPQNQATKQSASVENTNEFDQEDKKLDMPKTYDSIPTHTVVSNDIYEKQQNDIEEFSKSMKAEAPSEPEKDDIEEDNTLEAKV